MGDDDFFAGLLRHRPDRFGLQRRFREAGDAFQNRELFARRARHTIAADAGDTRWRAGHKRCKSGRSLGRKAGDHIVGDCAAFNELRQIGKFPFTKHLVNECGYGAVPGEYDGSSCRLAADRRWDSSEENRDRRYQRYQ